MNASGTWVRIPAPSPLSASAPTAPRWLRFASAVSAASTMSRPGVPRSVATKATPQASCSAAGSYRPSAGLLSCEWDTGTVLTAPGVPGVIWGCGTPSARGGDDTGHEGPTPTPDTLTSRRGVVLVLGVVPGGREIGGRGELRAGFTAWMTSPYQHKGYQRRHADQDGRPDVESQAGDPLGGVDAEHLDPEPTGRVGDDVGPEHPPVAPPVSPVQPDQQGRGGQVPEHLVQEGRVEERVGWHPVRERRAGRIDPQPPREVGRRAEELLVEPVPEPADGLGDQQGRRGRVREAGEPHVRTPSADPRPHRAKGDGAPDAQAALPDRERLHRVAARPEVRGRGGQHVVKASADDAEGHRPEGDLQHRVGLATAGHPPAGGDPERHDDPGHDRQRVGPHRQRAQVPHRLGRAGDDRGQHCYHRTSPRTPAARPPTTSARSRRPAAVDVASCSARTNALPTITPSAYRATSAACAAVLTPRPTQTRWAPARRASTTSASACAPTVARVPVTPIVDAAYTNPRDARAVMASRSTVELGATRNTRS